MQNLLNVVLRHPDAALDHLRAYGHLAGVELSEWLQAWQRRTLLTAMALVLAALCAGFLGLAVMAGALVSTPLSVAQWLAVGAPAALSALGSLGCLVALRCQPLPPPLEQLSRQWQVDAEWLLPPQQQAP